MKQQLKQSIFNLLNFSLIISNKLRGEVKLKKTLCDVVPDVTKQYTTFEIDKNNQYLTNKLRNLHAFQMSITLKAIELLKKTNDNDNINIVDIGDSSGTHLMYLNSLLSHKNLTTLSVNLDPVAVDKIKAKGLNAILCRAEELHLADDGIKADIFLSYEMLEHLFDPISFLHTMSKKSECDYFVVTVPYVHKSRVACQFVNNGLKGDHQAENTHIFELSPEDWDTIFKFSGWEIVYKEKYTQYPNIFPLNLTKYIWRYIDFDGFYGVILKKNDKFSKRYLDW